jgi:hypothetical protein
MLQKISILLEIEKEILEDVSLEKREVFMKRLI